ncbi:ABC transporter transmembrane domain-containing protein [Streptomyces sp. NPDC007917]|uniref:ABC transporter transmembrane domain-containing protein n=2 Tax=unclassified Streptomyces TaxID=2593676 RepID=UPI0036ED7953
MTDPAAHPGTPDIRGPLRYMWWLVASQSKRVAGGALLGSSWMVGLMLPPYLLSRAIDDGLTAGDTTALVNWSGAILAVGLLNAWFAIMRHRTMTRIRMDAAFRSVRIVTEHVTRLGAMLPRRVSSGEVFTIGFGDIAQIANVLTITGPGFGAVVAYAVVAVLLFTISPLLAVLVLLGVPVLVVLVGPLLGRLRGAESTYREHSGRLTSRLIDMTEGLRVLKGIGGKDVYAERYRSHSRTLQAEGYRVGAMTSWVQALGVGLPAVFLAAVTWVAARLVAEGSISAGELVSVYGYAAVLVVPVSFFIEGAHDLNHGVVAGRRLIRFLALEPYTADPEAGLDAPGEDAALHDPASGVEVRPGQFTALVSARSADSVAVVERLGRFAESDATWGGVPLARIALRQVRERILVAENEAALFPGTLYDVVRGRSERDPDRVDRAVDSAMARDIVQGLPDGYDSLVQAGGRNLSGGQRQRVRLARALLAEPEVLMALEPTSAVDAHTEAAVAARLYAHRAGRTTVVTTTSPLLLDRADVVCFLVDGRLAATGPHSRLLATHPDYRRLVSRGLDEPADDAGSDAPGHTAQENVR